VHVGRLVCRIVRRAWRVLARVELCFACDCNCSAGKGFLEKLDIRTMWH
jgi:hypothetical protein